MCTVCVIPQFLTFPLTKIPMLSGQCIFMKLRSKKKQSLIFKADRHFLIHHFSTRRYLKFKNICLLQTMKYTGQMKCLCNYTKTYPRGVIPNNGGISHCREE